MVISSKDEGGKTTTAAVTTTIPAMPVIIVIDEVMLLYSPLLTTFDCLEVKREYYQNCSVLGCVTQCSQSAEHLYEQFLRVQQIGFVTLGPLRYA